MSFESQGGIVDGLVSIFSILRRWGGLNSLNEMNACVSDAKFFGYLISGAFNIIIIIIIIIITIGISPGIRMGLAPFQVRIG
jgi:hypothetical protein